VPTLVFHHAADACWACQPYEARNIAGALKNAPIKKTIFTDGGGAQPESCEPMHHHGFVACRRRLSILIAAWIVKPEE